MLCIIFILSPTVPEKNEDPVDELSRADFSSRVDGVIDRYICLFLYSIGKYNEEYSDDNHLVFTRKKA